jgi:hypothetical protein
MQTKLFSAMLSIIFFTAFFTIFFTNFFTTTTFAQTPLQPGQTHFSTVSIVFQDFQLSGNLDFLRIYWNTSYIGEELYQIGVKCYLNCQPVDEKCVEEHWEYNCTYLGPPGPGVCSIQPVEFGYLYPLDADNFVVCIFYNPIQPSVEYKLQDGTYPEKVFKPIDFILFLSQNFTVTVGQQFSMPINVKNVGIFTDSYNINVTGIPENLVDIANETANVTIGPLTGKSFGNFPETFSSIAKIFVKSTESSINIIVTANSTTDNAIYRRQFLQIRAGVSSLPDFGLLGIIQIILLAAAILFLKL